MNQPQYSILGSDVDAVITVVLPGNDDSPFMAPSDHPNFKAIVGAAVAGEFDEIDALFDVGATISLKFRRLSERVTVEGETVYFDGVAVDSALTQQILRVLDDGASDIEWEALVNFFEKVQLNPDERSREQLYEWLKAREFTITPEGDLIGYKGVAQDSDGSFHSISTGNEVVRVDDKEYLGRIPNPLGATIEMARDLVANNPHAACARGLHVGTHDYASSFSRGHVLEVRVNPRDVVSVPADSGAQKMRTCRYTVVKPVEGKYDCAVLVDDATGETGLVPDYTPVVGDRVSGESLFSHNEVTGCLLERDKIDLMTGTWPLVLDNKYKDVIRVIGESLIPVDEDDSYNADFDF